MKALKIILIVVTAVVALNLIVIGINILQKGGSYKGKTMDEILGVPASKATMADLEKLSKPQLFQLFYAAPAPAFGELKGEYRAKTLDVGIMASSAAIYIHHFFGPGHWDGKAFYPFETAKGWGYNIFSRVKDDKKAVLRTNKMDTRVGKSAIDGGKSFLLNYSAYNGGTVHSMRDELRRINDRLYLGMGYMGLGGGSINPTPFVVMGLATPWVGPEKKNP